MPPEEEPRRSIGEILERRQLKEEAHKRKGEDFSLKTILIEAKVMVRVRAQAKAGIRGRGRVHFLLRRFVTEAKVRGAAQRVHAQHGVQRGSAHTRAWRAGHP